MQKWRRAIEGCLESVDEASGWVGSVVPGAIEDAMSLGSVLVVENTGTFGHFSIYPLLHLHTCTLLHLHTCTLTQPTHETNMRNPTTSWRIQRRAS